MYRCLAVLSVVGLFYSGNMYGSTGDSGYTLLGLLCSGFPLKFIFQGVTDA